MSIKLENTKCTCVFCEEGYVTDESDAFSPFLYCSGECEVLGEESEESESGE